MLIIGCDYHPGLQQIALVDTDTGELSEARLAHREQAEQFYRELKQGGRAARAGMESSGHSRWFERLLQELGFELWIGDSAEIQTKRVRKQKTDRQDAQLLLRLMMGRPLSADLDSRRANRDLRQLLWHRHRLVQMRTRVMILLWETLFWVGAYRFVSPPEFLTIGLEQTSPYQFGIRQCS